LSYAQRIIIANPKCSTINDPWLSNPNRLTVFHSTLHHALHPASYTQGSIIANPNCSTIIALMAVTPLHKLAQVKRMVVSTYQVRKILHDAWVITIHALTKRMVVSTYQVRNQDTCTHVVVNCQAIVPCTVVFT
jgi:hypothetical protein